MLLAAAAAAAAAAVMAAVTEMRRERCFYFTVELALESKTSKKRTGIHQRQPNSVSCLSFAVEKNFFRKCYCGVSFHCAIPILGMCRSRYPPLPIRLLPIPISPNKGGPPSLLQKSSSSPSLRFPFLPFQRILMEKVEERERKKRKKIERGKSKNLNCFRCSHAAKVGKDRKKL